MLKCVCVDFRCLVASCCVLGSGVTELGFGVFRSVVRLGVRDLLVTALRDTRTSLSNVGVGAFG